MRKPDGIRSTNAWQWALVFALSALAIVAALLTQTGDTRAQQGPQGLQNLTPEQMRQMFGGQGGSGSALMDQNPQPQYTILEPTAPSNPSLPQSRLEQIMSARAGTKLTQFGYDQLGIGRPINLPQIGGVQDDYILGPGDEIVITLRGQDNSEQRVSVDREGKIVLPRISPIEAAGKRFGDFRTELLAAVHNAYMATEAYVSIGRLRQISVMIAGEVNSPGVRILTGLSSPIDAILVSGGITKAGSLRNVQLIHNGHASTIDLYAFLTTGIGAQHTTLGDGDRIVVPPLRRVVAAAGWVRRPGIYELPPGQSAMTVGALENLVGGLEVRGQYRIGIMRVQANGESQLARVTGDRDIIRDGEILVALPGASEVVDRATLAGGTALSGAYPIAHGARLSSIIKEPGALGTSPYAVFGIISRRDPRTYLRTLIAFSPVGALSGEFDPPLLSGDIVRIFSMREGRLLSQSITEFAARKQFDEELTRNPYLASHSDMSGATSQAASEMAQGYGGSSGSGGSGGGTGGNPLTSSGLFPMGALAAAANNTSIQADAAAASMGAPAALTGQSGSSPAGNPTVSVPGTVNPNRMQSYLDAASKSEQSRPSAPPAPNFETADTSTGTTALNTEVVTVKDLASQLDVDTIVLLNFLSDHEVTLDGAVRGPGTYVVGPGVNLNDLVLVAGGTVRWADESGVELTTTEVNQQTGEATTDRRMLPLKSETLANYVVKPHDELRFRQVFTQTGIGPVALEGEVRFPGQYKIIRGERLGDLLKRAGGLTDVAYPYGTVYLRRSVASLEEDSFRRLADSINNQLLAAMSRTTESAKLDPQTFGAAQSFVQSLRTQRGLGRISVIADPTVLAARPEQNPLLEPGDVIYIPQRPSTVSVLGEVLQPGSYPYHPGDNAQTYLGRAGGFSAFADTSLTYVILPDGSAERLDQSWLPFDSVKLPPGSVIFVPRDIAPFNWTEFTINASQVFSQMAIAGASLAVISSNLK